MFNKSEIMKAKAIADEAKKTYEEMKKETFRELLDAMAENGGEFTASELSAVSGLNTHTIAHHLTVGYSWRSPLMSAIQEEDGTNRAIRLGTKMVTETYVRKCPDGTYDDSKTVTVKRDTTTYRVEDRDNKARKKNSASIGGQMIRSMIAQYERDMED